MTSTSSNSETAEGDEETWVIAAHGQYPYTPQRKLNLPTYKDLYLRSVSSLLCSMGALMTRIYERKLPQYKPNGIISFGNQLCSMDEVERCARVCNNGMTRLDYEYFFKRMARDPPLQNRSYMIHLDIQNRTVRRLIDDFLPRLSDYQNILISTCTTTGKIVLFLILPELSTIDAYCTTPLPYYEVRAIISKLRVVLRIYFPFPFTLKLRLQVHQTFHKDPIFMALFLAHILHGQGRYLLISERTCLNFKISLVSKFIELHDLYLGELQLRDQFHLRYTFYTTAYQNAHRRGGKSM